MTTLTRRGLLGAAATGALTLPACSTLPSMAAKAGPVRFVHGVASGDPLPDRVVIWTRVTPENDADKVQLSYEVKQADTGKIADRGTIMTSKARDFTVKVDATGLSPATSYVYHFTVLNSDAKVSSPEGRTRTTAAHGSQPVRLGVVSCSNWQFGRFNAYKALSRETEIDAIIHLGDYLYEYGIDGYGGEVGTAIGREHVPPTEIITLEDYRARHAQYKTDPDLQAAHAIAPWICTWDDHESANDSYRTGAENHDSSGKEGSWSDRKQAALQAYFEWMPVREPDRNIRSAAWRSFSFGDVLDLHALESRLTGRSENLDWSSALGDAQEAEEVEKRVLEYVPKVIDPARTMLGSEQEAWLNTAMKSSSANGKTWTVLANQVIMARVKLPDLPTVLTPEQIAAQDHPYVQRMIGFSILGLPFNLDAWDGFPAARDRLYASAKAASARLVTLTGDTHEAWANTLIDSSGEQRGVELGTTSITSPGSGAYVKNVPDMGEKLASANAEVEWNRSTGHGYIVATFTNDDVLAEYREVSSIIEPVFATSTVARFKTTKQDSGMSRLERV